MDKSINDRNLPEFGKEVIITTICDDGIKRNLLGHYIPDKHVAISNTDYRYDNAGGVFDVGDDNLYPDGGWYINVGELSEDNEFEWFAANVDRWSDLPCGVEPCYTTKGLVENTAIPDC